MEPSLTATFLVDDIPPIRAFYNRYFDTWYPFDCGWYVLIRLGRHDNAPEIGLMQAGEGVATFQSGAMINLLIPDVDELHDKMVEHGETIHHPLRDNPWGDRGFGVVDPAGLIVYCHRPIEPTDEFKPFIQKSPAARRGA